MFTYSREKELHEYIVDNFLDFFDFEYLSSEFTIDSGRVDILGMKDDIIYVVELKRDKVAQSTIEQLSNYLPDIELLHPDKEVIGIAAAPYIDYDLEMPSPNINTMKLKNVELSLEGMKQRQSFTFDKELIDRLKKVSKDTGIPQARIVSDAIEVKLKELEGLLKK